MKSAQPLSTGERSRTAVVTRRPARSAEALVTPAPKLTKLFQTKIVVPKAPSTDPRVIEYERLTAQLLAAQGRPAVTRATEILLGAGHAIPDTQEAHLQILEHSDEALVRSSLLALDTIFSASPRPEVKRRPVLEQRLKRLEEFADEAATRDAAAALRRKL